jgi:tetratricopeptide (TPR) repeat protein
MDHLDPQAGLDLLGSLSAEARRVGEHYLRCEDCRARLLEAIGAADGRPSRPGLAPVLAFDPMLARVGGQAIRAAAAPGEEPAAALLGELAALDHAERLARLEGQPRYWTLALAETLRQESEKAPGPAPALAFAQEAQAVACHLSPERYGRAVVAELLAEVWCWEADARRRLGDPEGAARAFACAEERLEGEALDAPARATLCHRLALLFGELGRVDVALGLLGRAADLWEELGHLGALGETLTARGWLYLNCEEPAQALPSLQAALTLLEPTNRPVTALRARYGVSLAYAKLGRRAEADRTLRHALSLLERLELQPHPPGFRWLQALVLEQAGRGEEAGAVLGELVQDLAAAGAHYDALLAGLELARCRAAHGQAEAAQQALESASGTAEQAGFSPQMRAAVAFVARFALEGKGEERSALLPELIAYLLRARHRPDLPFASGETPRTESGWGDLPQRARANLCRAAGLPRALAGPAGTLDDYSRELLRLTAAETARIDLTFEPED